MVRSRLVCRFTQHFKTLNISEESDQGAAREAFIKLAKKYHPDSGHSQANADKFQKIEIAYRELLQKFSQDRRDNECEGEFGLYYDQKKKKADEQVQEEDIKHTAPQHRQYLTYEGIGTGTPSQREKQYLKFKAMRAAESIIDYKVQQLNRDTEETALVAKEQKAARNIRTRYGIDRLVEDKIQESMARGDFDNLPNAGKPLKYQNHNPFVDIVTHKLNQILIDNGYAPEWVMLEREIRDEKARIRLKMVNYRAQLGTFPLSDNEDSKWSKMLSRISEDVSDLNKKIDKYNLVVPIMTKQTVHFPLDKVGNKILKEGQSKEENVVQELNIEQSKEVSSREETGLRAIIGIFKGR